MIRHYISCVFVVTLLLGCGDGGRGSTNSAGPGPRITEAQAGAIAADFARQKGIMLETYQRPRVEFNATRRQWDFSYVFKQFGVPGGHFSITVDETGAARFIGGL